MPPICIPMELKLAKPQSAKVAMVNDRGSSAALCGPSMEKATSSLSTMRVPSRFPMAAQSYLAGGHVRVGLEDGIYLSRGELASSNAALVEKAHRMIRDLGGCIATSREARRIVGLDCG